MAEAPPPTREDVENHWLRAIALPDMLKDGKLVENYEESKFGTFQVLNIEYFFLINDEIFLLTSCYHAKIDFLYDDVRRTLKLVVKKSPALPEAIYDHICYTELFSNEIHAYTRIIPALEEFTKIPLNFTKFYYSEFQPGFATVVLEDFKPNDWSVAAERFNLPYDHILVAVSCLGKFHGIGFAFKHKEPQKFTALTNNLKEARFKYRHRNRHYLVTTASSIERLIVKAKHYQPQIPPEFMNKIEILLKNYYEYIRVLVTRASEPLVTICHSKYMRNNIAFKYRDLSNEHIRTPIDALMFDLQTMRLSSPMLDLVTFLSVSTFSEIRNPNFEQIFNYYHKELVVTYEKYAEQEIPAFLSQENLLKEFTRYMLYGIFTATGFLQVLMEPLTMHPEELSRSELTNDDLVRDAWSRGGDMLDIELSNQIRELYEHTVRYNVNISEGFSFPHTI